MTEPILTTRRQLELLQTLQELADERAAAEIRIGTTLASDLASAEGEYRSTRERIEENYTSQRRSLENEHATLKQQASERLRDIRTSLNQKTEETSKRFAAEHQQAALGIDRKYKEAEWEVLAVFDASKGAPQVALKEATKRIQSRRLRVDQLQSDTNTVLAMRRLDKLASEHQAVLEEYPAEEALIAPGQSAEQQQEATLQELHSAVVQLVGQRMPSLLLEDFRIFGWLALAVAVSILPAGLLSDWSLWITPLLAIVLGAVATGLIYAILGPRAKRQTIEQFEQILLLLRRSRQLEKLALDEAESRRQAEAAAIAEQRDQDLAAANELRERDRAVNDARHKKQLAQVQAETSSDREEAEQKCRGVQAMADAKYPPLLDRAASDRQIALEENERQYNERTESVRQQHDADYQAMADRWRTGYQEVVAELAEMRRICDRLFPDWETTSWQDWQRPSVAPPAIQFGSCRLPLQAVKNGISLDAELVPQETKLHLPAWISLGEYPRMVITAEGAGRQAAVEVIQLLMLRFLTAIPAGKLRFTILDPAGLGENFATFMHLADYDEQLVGKRIWTDSRQIDERLQLLSDHMEKVLQKYLRNEFETIHEYNQQAGEVSEPYHVLVIANFPAGLSDAAMRKLQSIATSGPRCGVYTLMSVDRSYKLPTDYDLEELLTGAVHLDWHKKRFIWRYPLFEKLQLKLDALPSKEKLNELLRVTGEESRLASRVELPFSVIAPAADKVWTASAKSELAVPVGRAGAKEMQSLRLGRGTSQHALVSGKTGSGKSTLLHALITNMALHYSPREVEFYLVDFKKGVEFKTYATGELPHARVIAIESEREFGVSVLERLDEELRRRGEQFRDLGVQDLAGYRTKSGESLPRVLLVIDEFQELFVADDRLAQDAALLLDRLVRQGRAFGIHVLLGSQTLAGAYSLARSTIGQMAVRIALECSEADAHLILSDDNPAARLLSRPGEAIYNDQNGMVEGNSIFQVAWLPDQERQEYLAQIRRRQADEGLTVEPAIVFEGNVPANPLTNSELLELVDLPRQSPVVEPTVWLGSAVRIEPPTQMTFRRQRGNHLLVVGQDEPLALGILTTAAAALAMQSAGSEPQITVLDGSRPESPHRDTWQVLAATIPGQLRTAAPREVSRVIDEFADEVSRRSEQPHENYASRFLIIHDLAQFRDLRLSEDEFSFTSSFEKNGKPTPADKRFREILREGPSLGVHVLLWCDSYNSLARVLDRLVLRELDYRVALQMSNTDSTSLIDSPAAGRIGEQRAIFYRDDMGTHVKFRPYGRPSTEWLHWLSNHVAGEKVS